MKTHKFKQKKIGISFDWPNSETAKRALLEKDKVCIPNWSKYQRFKYIQH